MSIMKWCRTWFLVGLAFSSTGLMAQTDQATVRGTATDPTGAVVPNANIELTNVGTNVTRKAITNENGDYEIPYVNAGTYRLTGAATGFKNFAADNIILTGREVRRIDLAFQLGGVGSEVTVNAGAAVIQTEGSQIAGGFSGNAYVDSPLSQDFFPQSFMTTLPNVQTNNGGWSLYFAGQGPSQTQESMDGVSNDGSVNLVQNMNDFQDLQVVQANSSAEYSRVANFTMVGKSGTNELHGKVYYDLNNSALNAREFFDQEKPPYKQHQGGAYVSGPIRRNKTFFYGSYSLTRIPSASFYTRNVPTLAFRQGDFSALSRQLTDPLTGQPFPGNQIPASRINPTSQKLQEQYIPTPNQGSPNSTANNFGYLFPHPTDLYKWDSVNARIDHKISEKNTLFGRFINRLTPYVLAGNFPEVGTWTRMRNHHSIVVSDTHVFSPALINTARWGWARDYIVDGQTEDGFTPVTGDAVVKAIGLQGVNPKGYSAMGFPQMNITGVSALSQQAGGVNQRLNTFEYADSITWSKGSHVMKFGGELRHFNNFTGQIPTGTYGTFTFNGSLTGNGYADFLLGLPYQSTRLDPLTNRTSTSQELGFFATDTFKLTRKLTLDYGLRWDFFGAAKYADGLQYNWDPATGNVIVPQAALSEASPLYPATIKLSPGNPVPHSKLTQFRPRVGVAYRLQDTLVLRGGYGIFSEYIGNFPRLQGTGPFQISETYFNQIQNGQPLFAFPNPFPSSLASAVIPSQSVSGYPADTDNGMIHQFNASLEKQFGSNGVRVSYIGSRSRGMNYTLQLNKPQPSLTAFTASRRPWPQFVGASFTQSNGRENYNAGQIELQRRMGALTLDAHYTLSNNMADYLNLENPYDHRFWNRVAFNSRHRAVISINYDLPFGRGKRYLASAPAVVNGILGGWQLGWISYFQSGQYFSPAYSGADPSNTNTSGGLPDRLADGNFPPDQRDVNRWFDASAFRVPPAGRFGNSGVNILEGPRLNVHHFSLLKSFKLTDRVRLVYQAMITDIFNHPNFDFPNNNISVPDQVGVMYQLREGGGGGRELADSRRIEMRLRIEF